MQTLMVELDSRSTFFSSFFFARHACFHLSWRLHLSSVFVKKKERKVRWVWAHMGHSGPVSQIPFWMAKNISLSSVNNAFTLQLVRPKWRWNTDGIKRSCAAPLMAVTQCGTVYKSKLQWGSKGEYNQLPSTRTRSLAQSIMPEKQKHSCYLENDHSCSQPIYSSIS